MNTITHRQTRDARLAALIGRYCVAKGTRGRRMVEQAARKIIVTTHSPETREDEDWCQSLHAEWLAWARSAWFRSQQGVSR